MDDSLRNSMPFGITPNPLEGVTNNQVLMIQGLNTIAAALNGMLRVTGTFTMAAATSITVPQAATQATSFPLLIPMNAAAGTLMAGANTLYLSARVAGTSFTLSTAGGGAAAGTEQFAYVLITPV
jgi:hypothetical protein